MWTKNFEKNISHAPLLVICSHPPLHFLLPPRGIRPHPSTPPSPSKGQPDPEEFSSLDIYLTTQTQWRMWYEEWQPTAGVRQNCIFQLQQQGLKSLCGSVAGTTSGERSGCPTRQGHGGPAFGCCLQPTVYFQMLHTLRQMPQPFQERKQGLCS